MKNGKRRNAGSFDTSGRYFVAASLRRNPFIFSALCSIFLQIVYCPQKSALQAFLKCGCQYIYLPQLRVCTINRLITSFFVSLASTLSLFAQADTTTVYFTDNWETCIAANAYCTSKVYANSDTWYQNDDVTTTGAMAREGIYLDSENGQKLAGYVVERRPTFTDGWGNYLEFNLSSNVAKNDRVFSDTYHVMANFTIDTLGKVTEIAIIYSDPPCPPCAEEVVRVLSTAPAWVPAIEDNVPVSSGIKQLVSFKTGRSQFEIHAKDNMW